MLEIKNLERYDYFNGFIQLMEQLTTTEADKISHSDFIVHMEEVLGYKEVFVIRDGNRVVATASFLREPKFVHSLCYLGHIEDVVVDKEYRGKNLGKKLVEYIMDMAQERGCYKVVLDCKEENIGFYKKCGLDPRERQMVKYF